MKKSILPGFIKRWSVSNVKVEDSNLELLKEADRSHRLIAECGEEIQTFQEKYGLELCVSRRSSNISSDSNYEQLRWNLSDEYTRRKSEHRLSIYEGFFGATADVRFILPSFYNDCSEYSDIPMVDQEDVIALTKHVRSFSEALNNLRNTFKESCVDGAYNDADCQSSAHSRLSDVLKILKDVLAKYPPLHSYDILTAAASIIAKIRSYNYAEGEEGPTDFYAAIDQLALCFSGSVSDFLMGDKEMSSPNSTNITLDQYDENDGDLDGEEEYDAKFFANEDYDKFNESEDSLDRLDSDELQKAMAEQSMPESDSNITPPPLMKDNKSKSESALQRTDELDKTLLSIEGSVDIALQRTKVWAKYAKDILNYVEKRSHLELEFSRSTAKLATQTRTSIMEESFLPFQSTYVTALENDIQFANHYQKSCQSQLQQIVDKLTQSQKDHDVKRAKIKTRWKLECKRLLESRENLRGAKKLFIQKQKELEKFNKQQSEGKDDKGFSIGKKKGQEDFKKSAEDSEEQYRQCVDEANTCQQEIEKTKADLLLELRQLVYHCDLTMKSITIAYFQMMNLLLSPLPVQYRTLVESSNMYEEGQQFAEFVRLQQSTCNQAMCPTYAFEPYRGEGADKFNNLRHGNEHSIFALSSEDFANNTTTTNIITRRSSVTSAESDHPPSPGGRKIRQAWGTAQRTKGSATDDTDSLSSRSLPGSPAASPTISRKLGKTVGISNDIYSDEDHELKEDILKNTKQIPGLFKNQILSAAAKMHLFRKLRSPSKCKECDSYVYFNGAECERCGLICHKKCLENLTIKCGNKRLPRKMTTFGVDFHQHLAATKRKDIPYIIEKCIDAIDECGLSVKGIYRVSGVKSKVEKLCQQFETAGGDLVDLSDTPPHLVASVLKLYLRQLPETLLTFKMYDSFIKVAKDSMNLKLENPENLNEPDSSQYEEIISQLHDIVKKLPEANFFTAAKLIRHLRRVADNQVENQMSAANLAIVFGPTLLRPEGNSTSLAAVMDMSHQARAVELLIVNSQIFSVNKDGEIDIEIATGEKFTQQSRPRKAKHQKKKISTTLPEHKKEDSTVSVGTEFTQELLFMMESSQKRMDEDRVKPDPNSGQLPGQAIEAVYDNLEFGRESDILTDLPEVVANNQPPTLVHSESRSSVASADYESCHSRLDSVESLLSGEQLFGSASPPPLPDTSHEEILDDDVWLNSYGRPSPVEEVKEPANRKRSSSASEVIVEDPLTFSRKKKNSSFSRLETTTYSFSLGNSAKESSPAQEVEEGDDTTIKEDEEVKKDDKETIEKPTSPVSPGSDDSLDSFEPSVWVKRDGRERVPVRKHLKTVNIKSTTNVVSVPAKSNSPQLSPNGLKNAPFTLSESGDKKATGSNSRERMSSTASTESEKDNQKLMLKVGAVSQQIRDVTDGGEKLAAIPTSPSKAPPPAVLPKPKKPLDKKSWTADLIKSKSQSLSEQPQPGSLNDKLLQNSKPPKTAPQANKSVKEILTKFDTPTLSTASLDLDNTATGSCSGNLPNEENSDDKVEKYV